MRNRREVLIAGAAWALLALAPAPGLAEPRVELRLAAFPGASYPNFASVVVPAQYGRVEIWIQDALGEIQISTVRVRLNELPMTPFVTVNPLPRGVRLLLKEGLTLNPEYRLRPSGENVLAFAAQDDTKAAYQGQFYLTVDPALEAPREAPMRARPPAREVGSPEQKEPPRIAFTSEWPKATTETVLILEAEATDAEGLSRLVVEVDGRDVDEVVIQNDLPYRKHAGWMSSGKPPGEIDGDSRRLVVSVPVRVRRDITVVAIRAENRMGLRTRIDRTVLKAGK
jgi:hypothetical protein